MKEKKGCPCGLHSLRKTSVSKKDFMKDNNINGVVAGVVDCGISAVSTFSTGGDLCLLAAPPLALPSIAEISGVADANGCNRAIAHIKFDKKRVLQSWLWRQRQVETRVRAGPLRDPGFGCRPTDAKDQVAVVLLELCTSDERCC